MDDYNKIIETLNVKFHKARHVDILHPIRVNNYYDVENMLIFVNKGNLSYSKNNDHQVGEGEFLFVPAARGLNLMFGSREGRDISNEEFLTHREKYFRKHQPYTEGYENFIYVSFDVKVFNSVNFFTSLDIPAFQMSPSRKLAALMHDIVAESENAEAGNERIVAALTDYLVVEVIRYILKNKMFVEKLATNSTYFKDPRLIDLFSYIKLNLPSDLSNKMLANVANVSEDYVGQYFKSMTGINPQDYIEYQRMETAIQLLRTSKKSIKDIGIEVGYKDTAYFCRRFKMMFGIPAGKMRRRESLMNV